jgi:hypothetical protein
VEARMMIRDVMEGGQFPEQTTAYAFLQQLVKSFSLGW